MKVRTTGATTTELIARIVKPIIPRVSRKVVA
jgi:hypothetical protein